MLLDTSGLLALVDRREAHHAAANRLSNAATVRLTHSYVLAEFVPLSESRGLSRSMMLAFSRRLLTNRGLDIVWVGEGLHGLALSFLEARRDKRYSLCDAVSFILMEERGLTEALTTDHHFVQAGFRRLLG